MWDITWSEEQERIEEASEKSEFYQWLAAKAKGLGKNFKKGFGQYQRLKKPIIPPKTIQYSPNNPLPSPQDYRLLAEVRSKGKGKGEKECINNLSPFPLNLSPKQDRSLSDKSKRSSYEGQDPPRIKFKKGERHSVNVKLSKLGWQFILDRSFMAYDHDS